MHVELMVRSRRNCITVACREKRGGGEENGGGILEVGGEEMRRLLWCLREEVRRREGYIYIAGFVACMHAIEDK